MKKKVNISVCDMINKIHSPKNKNTTINYKAVDRLHMDSPLIVDKATRFQDLYKKVVEEHSKNGQNSCLKVVYESKKVTPVNTHRNKKLSIGSSITHTSKSGSVLTSSKSIPKVSPHCETNKGIQKQKYFKNKQNSTHSRKNSQTRKQSVSKQIKESKQRSQRQENKQKKQCKIIQKFQQCLQMLNHEQHSHLRQRNQCFLSQRQIDNMMTNLGYNIKNIKYLDILTLLEADIYGGVPSQNLKQFIILIQSSDINLPYFVNKSQSGPSFKKKLPKIVDNNLKLCICQQSKNMIIDYFKQFKQGGIQQKQNYPLMANTTVPKSIQSFEQLLKQKNYFFYQQKSKQKPKQSLQPSFNVLSPNKKINSTAISQLIEALGQSQKKRQLQQNKTTPKVQISNKKLNQQCQDDRSNQCQTYKQNMETFRKVQASGFDDNGQYNFSRELSGDRLLSHTQQENIIQLKNRLNQALKRSSHEANQYFSQDRQYNNFLYSNSLKFSRKPILSVDVNLGEGVSQKIIVFEGQTAKQVSDRLAAKFTISIQTKLKFEKMLQSHLNTMLWKIDELSQEMSTDRELL